MGGRIVLCRKQRARLSQISLYTFKGARGLGFRVILGLYRVNGKENGSYYVI